MTTKRFHVARKGKQREVGPPARLRFSARRGVTLVEVLISALILTIVSVAWFKIICIQSARKEARRREAVERLAGMMDAFLYENRTVEEFARSYEVSVNTNINALTCIALGDDKVDYVHPMFENDVSPVGYRLSVVVKKDWEDGYRFTNWPSRVKWLVGELYNKSGCTKSEAGPPFFQLPVCLGL